MDSKKYEEIKNGAIAVLSIVVLYLFLFLTGVGCPIHFLTGVSCPGCGMTRAWKCLLAGNYKAAFHYHPLVIIPALGLIVYINKGKIKRIYINYMIWFVIVLFVGVYLFRISDSSNRVVEFNPKDGFIYKIINKILRYINL